MKKFFLYTWIILQIIVIAYLWITLTYAAIVGKPLANYIHWEWWMFLFMLDLWTAKFFKELPKRSE